MTAGQSTRRMSSVSLAQAAIAGLVGATLLAGGLIGAAITSQIGTADVSRMTISAAGLPPVMFDAVQFRAEERGSPPAAATFDAVQFRAEERGSLPAAATFDAVQFRAEERGSPPVGPISGHGLAR